MMVVYSTEPGKVALDGTGRNSPFTAALLRHIDSEGESISDVMIDVRNDVLKETGGKQRPFESASLTGQFYFKPAPVPAPGAASASTADQIASLREEIARLQAVQGQLVKSQQEQLAALQQKLENETNAPDGTAPSASRVITVEPAEGNAPPGAKSASGSTPTAKPEGGATEVAAADSKDTDKSEGEAPSAVKAPIPEEPTRQELAQDILSELKRLGCYFGKINGNWSGRSKLALERFNRVSALDLALDDPEQASLDALKDWKGRHCPVEARIKAHRPAAAAAPKKRVAPPRKAATAAPPRTPSPVRPRPGPAPRHGTAEQNELKRMFPSTAWPE